MRFGIFAATYGAILLVVWAFYPLPVVWESEPPGRELRSTDSSVCLTIEYADSSNASWMPAAIHLGLEVDHAWQGRIFYQARLIIGGSVREASWRLVGADSLEFGWHHSPHFRIPSKGTIRRGRVYLPNSLNLLDWLEADDPLIATESSCDAAANRLARARSAARRFGKM